MLLTLGHHFSVLSLLEIAEDPVAILGSLRLVWEFERLDWVRLAESLSEPSLPLLNVAPLVFFSEILIVLELFCVQNVPNILQKVLDIVVIIVGVLFLKQSLVFTDKRTERSVDCLGHGAVTRRSTAAFAQERNPGPGHLVHVFSLALGGILVIYFLLLDRESAPLLSNHLDPLSLSHLSVFRVMRVFSETHFLEYLVW